MSGYVRTLEKRLLKSLGLKRETQTFEMTPNGPQMKTLKKGEGNIVNMVGDNFGRQWPRVRSLGEGAYAPILPSTN